VNQTINIPINTWTKYSLVSCY